MGQREDTYRNFMLLDQGSEVHAIRAPRTMMRIAEVGVEVWQEVSFTVPKPWDAGGFDDAKTVIDAVLKAEG